MFLCNTEQCCKVLTGSKQDWFSSSVAFAMETSAHRPRLQPGLHHHPVFWGIGLCGGEALSGGDLSLLDALITSMQHYIPLCRYFWACRVAHLRSHISPNKNQGSHSSHSCHRQHDAIFFCWEVLFFLCMRKSLYLLSALLFFSVRTRVNTHYHSSPERSLCRAP